jgi:hypothetical protein
MTSWRTIEGTQPTEDDRQSAFPTDAFSANQK